MGKIHLAQFWIQHGMKCVKLLTITHSVNLLSCFSLVNNILFLPNISVASMLPSSAAYYEKLGVSTSLSVLL